MFPGIPVRERSIVARVTGLRCMNCGEEYPEFDDV